MTINPGDAVGLVGLNGSGKSTLLKIVNGVMLPYAGRVDVRGRVGALIEVRAGIHPELTGRENAFLFGSILGLRRREVAKRFDDIIAFAEIENAVDRPVKFFSSGMQMRLAFAVAAFLEPDVLLVDEALAVGDAAFQQRCLERMRTVLSRGTTLVFVSHDLPAVESICMRALWLHHGVTVADGDVQDVLANYRRFVEESAETAVHQQGPVRLAKCAVRGSDGGVPRTDEPLEISLVLDSETAEAMDLCIGITEGTASPVLLVQRAVDVLPGEVEIRCRLAHLPFPGGRYYVWIGGFNRRARDIVPWHPAARFDVAGPPMAIPPRGVVRLAPVVVNASWEVERR